MHTHDKQPLPGKHDTSVNYREFHTKRNLCVWMGTVCVVSSTKGRVCV